MNDLIDIPSIKVKYDATGKSKKLDELGMREMQARAYNKRGEQYLLIKSPPASGKSRALMFLALDKVQNQGVRKSIVVVPETSIGRSFSNTNLSKFGFWTDWEVYPKWNLCNSPGTEGGKVKSVKAFLDGDDNHLICTHATFRFSVDKFGIEVFDNCVIAVDEFHHISANPENKLGNHLKEFIARNRVHIIAMTGSYFRGDAEAVLAPEDESKFETVTYTYYEQLNGYEYLKELIISYNFYSGNYIESIMKILNPLQKTIIHIPNVNAKESTKDKIREVEEILDQIGEWQGTDPETGFQLIKLSNGKMIKIADLVDDDMSKRIKVQQSLRSEEMEQNREYVDIIIALGMAKEGFDWIWCEHALTVGYRSSLTEIVQIIGRATRDAPNKEKSFFTNLVVEPDATEERVTDAVNDTLKAIAASLLMEQVLAPRFEFKPKNSVPSKGFDYGDNGYQEGKTNIGFNDETGKHEIEINGLKEPKSDDAKRVCTEDINEIIADVYQNTQTVEKGLFYEDIIPEELTQVAVGKIVSTRYPQFDEEDQEAIRQHVVANLNIKKLVDKEIKKSKFSNESIFDITEGHESNTAFIDNVRNFALDVRELDVDLIDSINPFEEAYSILSKSMNEENLRNLRNIITAKKSKFTLEEARDLAKRASHFKKERGRVPSLDSSDPWEKRIAEGMIAFARLVAEEKAKKGQNV